MIRNIIFESQGTDDEVNKLTSDLTEKIYKGYKDGKTMEFNFKMKVDYLTKEGNCYFISIPVNLISNRYNDLCVYGADTESKYWEEDTKNPFYIRINLKGRITPSYISDNISHELIHVKTIVREFLEKRFEPTWLFVNYRKNDPLGDLQYFLSDNEISSYVQGTYSYCKNEVKKILNKKRRKPTKKEFEKIIKRSLAWSWIEWSCKALDEINAKDIEERIEDENSPSCFYNDATHKYPIYYMNNALHKITGISSTSISFKKFYYNKLEQVKKKLLKTAYKGYLDAIGENNKI